MWNMLTLFDEYDFILTMDSNVLDAFKYDSAAVTSQSSENETGGKLKTVEHIARDCLLFHDRDENGPQAPGSLDYQSLPGRMRSRVNHNAVLTRRLDSRDRT